MKNRDSKNSFHDFFKRIIDGSVLISDYDGTLAPFVKDRMLAFPYPGVFQRLKEISHISSTRLVIMSGRSLTDFEFLLPGLLNVEIWGSHGRERRLTDGTLCNIKLSERESQGLRKAKNFLRRNDISDFLEIKPYSVAIHWRGLEEEKKLELEKLSDRLHPFAREYDFEILEFDNGREFRPKFFNKGDAIHQLMKEVSSSVAIAYLGDDCTDEDAFAALGARGLKVLVRENGYSPLADLVLSPPSELLDFFDHWIQLSKFGGL